MRKFIARLMASALVATGLGIVTPAVSSAAIACDSNAVIYVDFAGTIYRGLKDGSAPAEAIYSTAGSVTGLAAAEDGTIMWSTYMAGEVFMGSCDGTMTKTQVTLPAGADNLFQMSYSVTQDKFLAAGTVNGAAGLIAINRDGTNATTIWTGAVAGLLGVGSTGDDIYFCNGTLYAATLSGFTMSAPTALYTSNSNGSPAFACDGIAVDTKNDIIYWADYTGSGVNASIWKAPLDGAGTPTIHYAGGGGGVSPSGLVIDFSVEPYGLFWGTDGGTPSGLQRGDVAGNPFVAIYSTPSPLKVNSVAILPNLPDAIPNPTITEISPTSGSSAGGTELTITGTGFAEGATVTVGGAECVVSAVTETSITCTTSAHAAGAVDVVVTNTNGGSAVSQDGFTYLPVNPVVLSASPSSGPIAGGTSVTISGSGFAEGATVTIGGAACEVTAVTETSITCTTSAGVWGLANVVVTNLDGGVGTGAGIFAYVDPPVVVKKKVSAMVFFNPGSRALTKSTLASLGRMARSVPKDALNVKVHLVGVVQYNGVTWNDRSLGKWRAVMVARHMRSLGVIGKYTAETRASERLTAKTARRVQIILTYTLERKK